MKIGFSTYMIYSKLPEGELITYESFPENIRKSSSLRSILSRYVKSGKLSKLRSGVFYKPKTSEYFKSKLPPTENKIVKTFIKKNNGVLGGYYVFRTWGLTTQHEGEILILTNHTVQDEISGPQKIKYLKTNLPINNLTRSLVQILHVIQNIDQIFESKADNSLKIIEERITALNKRQKVKLISLAMKLPARYRALTGAILEKIDIDADKLYETLGKKSEYRFKTSFGEFINTKKWKIKR